VAAAAGVVGWAAYSHAVSGPVAATGTAQGAAGGAPPVSLGGSGGTGGQAGTGTAPAPPAGYRWFRVTAASAGTAAGFQVAAPASWHLTRQGPTTYLRPPAGGSVIAISLAPFTAAQPQQEASVLAGQAVQPGRYPGYRLIAISPAIFQHSPAATWRFGWREPGVGRVQVLELLVSITTGSVTQPYVLSVSAPALGFPHAVTVYRRVLQTFRPLP
jgi:hypothetical protein